jgi:hypothetical protein
MSSRELALGGNPKKSRHVDLRGGSGKPAQDYQDDYQKSECAAPSYFQFAPTRINKLEVGVAMGAHLHCSPSLLPSRMWDSHRVILRLLATCCLWQPEGPQHVRR